METVEQYLKRTGKDDLASPIPLSWRKPRRGRPPKVRKHGQQGMGGGGLRRVDVGDTVNQMGRYL